MFCSITLLALWGAVVPQINKVAIHWESDYAQARALGGRDQKPLAVFIGRGSDGWNKLIADGKLDADVRKALAERYVPVYINQDAEGGQQLAEAFGLSGKSGLVISDRTGGVMAFRHEGEISLAELTRHLTRFSNPNHVVSTTEGFGAPTITYSAPSYIAPAAYQNPYGNPFACQT